jgi:hypothetical protein
MCRFPCHLRHVCMCARAKPAHTLVRLLWTSYRCLSACCWQCMPIAFLLGNVVADRWHKKANKHQLDQYYYLFFGVFDGKEQSVYTERSKAGKDKHLFFVLARPQWILILTADSIVSAESQGAALEYIYTVRLLSPCLLFLADGRAPVAHVRCARSGSANAYAHSGNRFVDHSSITRSS